MYIRISREDGENEESQSISNQRNIIKRYIKENNLSCIKEYIDDGVSGTTFERTGFCKMLKDIENGIINMVITKDLSRLGRDYIKTGYYIEEYFPKKDVRFVAITDGIDTYGDNINNEITPFKAILNDMYAKDISKKIRSVYREKQKQGEYLCSIPAYGYQKNPIIKNKLIVDKQVKFVVEKIFEMYIKGHGSNEIVNYLNMNNYLSPLGYRKTGIVQANEENEYKWNEVTICNILKNEVYIGNAVQNKKTVVSYKVKKIKKVEEKSQIRVSNTHEPIIDKDVFEKVQCIIKKRGANTRGKYDYLLRGLLFCKHCRRKLQIVRKKEYIYIVCGNKQKCGVSINYNDLEKNILYMVKQILKIYSDKNMLYKMYESIQSKNNYINEIEQVDKEIININKNFDNLYIDKINGILQEEDYIRIAKKLDLNRKNLYKQKDILKQKIMNRKTKKEINKNIVKKFLDLEEIDSMYLYRLIDRIEIDKKKGVYIFWDFVKPTVKNSGISTDIEELLNKNKIVK